MVLLKFLTSSVTSSTISTSLVAILASMVNIAKDIKQGVSSAGQWIASVSGWALGTALTAGLPYGAYELGNYLSTTDIGSKELIATFMKEYGDGMGWIGKLITPDVIEWYLKSIWAWSADAISGVTEWLSSITPDALEHILSQGADLWLWLLTSGTVGAALTYKLPILINVVWQWLIINTIDKVAQLISWTAGSVKDAARWWWRNKGWFWGKLWWWAAWLAVLLPATVYHAAKSGMHWWKEFLQFVGKTADSYLWVAQAFLTSGRRLFSGKGWFLWNLKASWADIHAAMKNIYKHDIRRKKTWFKATDRLWWLGYQGKAPSEPESKDDSE